MTNKQAPILIIGMSAAGADTLSSIALARIRAADLLAGGKRHLAYFADFAGERVPIAADMTAVAERLLSACGEGKTCVVLASGDPLCYGIGATLRRWFEADELEIWPAPTAFQLAFAALSEPWHGAALLSAHARPIPDVIRGISQAEKAAILTDSKQTPAVIAQAMLDAGFAPEMRTAVCENLGAPTQKIIRLSLSECAQQSFAPLNVMVIWNEALFYGSVARAETDHSSEETIPSPQPLALHLPDSAYRTSNGQITKREIRMLSLAELALGPSQVMWDVGAGSGSVGIEAARSRPSARVFAVEKRPEFCDHIRHNLTQYPAPNLFLSEGMAPDIFELWPDPDCVFIGGSGGRLAEIIEVAKNRLRLGGRLVCNVVIVENLAQLRQLLPSAQLVQLQASRGQPILDKIRFEALNPVFMIRWEKGK